MNTNCPRCAQFFDCKVDDIANCQCAAVEIDSKTKTYLDKTSYSCLCKDCLIELNQIVLSIESSTEIKEGIHYYLENGFMVFKEYYHIQRGECCGNGCRHCAYGNK